MDILGRLGNVVRSYLNDETDSIFGKGRGPGSGASAGHRDPDLKAAFDELDDFLSGKEGGSKKARAQQEPPRRQVPAETLADFAELGLSPDASAAQCKAAYKKLLKTHHPDHHAGSPEALKKATEKTARVNAAYRRIQEWQKS
ncbi:MAG: J domain-containing protein [Treponema sp.]|nr:J domain-containing protein [Treponema sp.]